jgi:dCMP deaminase
MNQDKWDQRYLELAALGAGWSKDPRAGVGAVVVRNNRVVAIGFNGFPSEVLDREERLQDKETKLQMTVHAEINALIAAGKDSDGATIYVHGKPVCARCAGSIIQAGVRRVVAEHPEENKESSWHKLGRIALEMFAEAGVQFHAKRIAPRTDPSESEMESRRGNAEAGLSAVRNLGSAA